MTTTILAAIVLSGSLGTAAKPSFQAQTDYGQAMRQAAAEGKPVAVLIGKGDSFARLMADASLPESTATLLREKYVCVSVDVSTTTGSQLAGQFQLTDGLVISSVGGTYQALRQSGTVTAADLAKHAPTYVGSSTPVTTVTVGTTAPAAATTPSTYVYPSNTVSPSTVYPAGGYYYPSSPSYYPRTTYPGAPCVGNR